MYVNLSEDKNTKSIMKEFYKVFHHTIRSSQALVYTYYDEKHTYSELYQEMLKFNTVLSLFQKQRIAHFTAKGFHSYSAIFATLLSGNTWIPLTKDAPELRNLDILKIASPEVILTDEALPQSLKDFSVQNQIKVFTFDEILSQGGKEHFKEVDFNKYDLAYIMFTSGSTGIPKGVPMTHENYINFVNNMLEILPFHKNEVFSDFHDFAFDISIFYLFCCVLTESAFAPIIKEQDKIIPLNHIEQNKVTVWSSVPSVILRMKTFKPKGELITPVRIMFLCGEPFRLDVLSYCFNNMKLKDVYNFYGLTETGVENFYHKCSFCDLVEYQDIGFVPIGKPLKGNNIKINDENELLISGCQVTPGYLGGISPDKFEIIDGVRWFHTGDIVVEYKDVYFCKGRLDSQVKLSGYRVELMDIEAHMRRLDGVEEAVCFVTEERERRLLIAALKAKNKLDLNTLQTQLKKKLPLYMIPKDIFYLYEMPLNKNGKTDRKKVQEFYQDNIKNADK